MAHTTSLIATRRSRWPGVQAAALAGVLIALSACATKKADIEAGVEGLQTAKQKQQAQRFAVNSLLGTRHPGNEEELDVRPLQQVRHVAQPDGCASGPFLLRQLPVEEMRLSNQRVTAAASMLSTMGYSVINADLQGGTTARRFSCHELPVILTPVMSPDSDFTIADNRARDYIQGGTFGFEPLRQGSSEDLDRLIVFYHPEKQQDLDLLKSALRHDLDAASPQVFLETLVVEVNREDSEELGLDWENANIARSSLLSFGALSPGLGNAVDFIRDTRRGGSEGIPTFDPGDGVRFRLKALIERGRAQVLSRPSVLALSNRQAVIQIVDVIQTPNLSSRVDINGNFTVSDYSFEPLLIGITLNLRPRVSSDRRWVSMEIDATVDAEVDENSGEVVTTDANGETVQLATKPGLSSRKVRTFTRIPDRTPIIIGGLAAANSEQIKSRVPILGDLPFFGALFGASDNEIQEREIIIVLTPYVLDESNRGVATNGYLGASPSSQPQISQKRVQSGGREAYSSSGTFVPVTSELQGSQHGYGNTDQNDPYSDPYPTYDSSDAYAPTYQEPAYSSEESLPYSSAPSNSTPNEFGHP